jgi:hypothetical protein
MMSIIREKKVLAVLFLSLFVLGGCMNKETPGEKAYSILEKTAEAEDGFEKQQDPLVKLEKQEKELYDQIIALGMKEFDQVKNLSDEALEAVGKREELMNKEQESIDASKEEFAPLEDIIPDIEDKEAKESAEELYKVMMDRYSVHDQLYSEYKKGLELDKELYSLFKKEDLTMEQLEAQIDKINQSYDQLMVHNKEFNELTKKYNEIKISFYKQAGVEVAAE